MKLRKQKVYTEFQLLNLPSYPLILPIECVIKNIAKSMMKISRFQQKKLKLRNTVSYLSNDPSHEEEYVPPPMLRVRESEKYREIN